MSDHSDKATQELVDAMAAEIERWRAIEVVAREVVDAASGKSLSTHLHQPMQRLREVVYGVA